MAGYVKDGPDGHELKHLVINGGFNPGNSGGPLVRKLDNHVIGIVVAKARIYPPHIKKLIDTLNAQMSGVVYPGTDGNGKAVTVFRGPDCRGSLRTVPQHHQVMIGEAISVSELRAFLKEKQPEVQ